MRTLIIVAGAALALSMPVQAQEPNAYPITNVNLRAGPGTEYPIIFTVATEAPITILGCLADYTWCDTVFEDHRGWMSAVYLAGYYEGQYYYLKDWAPDLDYQVVTFNVGTYWDTYYRDQPFYAQRTRWVEPDAQGYVDNAVFYDRLSPHGSWTWTQGQYVWVPRGVDRSWRPYTRGRWVYTAAGWTWASEEPFGWATYHYGRWGYSDRMGWFWVPGNRWAPAWVAWRQDDDYLGWAPLPPTYDRGGIDININIGNVPAYYWSVVPSRDFLAPDLDRYYVQDRRPFFERSRPIGHTTIVNNNTVVNNIVNVQYVEEKTNTKVVEKTIKKTKNINQAGTMEGEALEVYEPALDEKPQTLAPPEPKTVEEVAANSETKGQAEGTAGTEDMLTPPEVDQALKERKSKKARAGGPKDTGPGEAHRDEASDEVSGVQGELDPSLPKGAEVDAPPPGAGKKENKGKPAVAAEELGPKPGGKTRKATPGPGGPAEGSPGEAAQGLEGAPGEDQTMPDDASSASSDSGTESAREAGPGGKGGLPPGKPPQDTSEGPKGLKGAESPGPKAAGDGGPRGDGPKGKESPGPKAAGGDGPNGAVISGPKAAGDGNPKADGPKGKESSGPKAAGDGDPRDDGPKGKDNPGPKAGGNGPKGADSPDPKGAGDGGPGPSGGDGHQKSKSGDGLKGAGPAKKSKPEGQAESAARKGPAPAEKQAGGGPQKKSKQADTRKGKPKKEAN